MIGTYGAREVRDGDSESFECFLVYHNAHIVFEDRSVFDLLDRWEKLEFFLYIGSENAELLK